MTQNQTAWWREIDLKKKQAIFAAWLGYVFDGFDFMLITYIIIDLQKDLNISYTQVSTLFFAAFVSRPIGGAFFGSIADKYGRKTSMMLSICTYSVGTFLSGLSPNFFFLFAFRMIVGMGMAGEYASSSTYAVESWPLHLRSKASAFLVSGFSVGNIIASQTIPTIAAAYGWRVCFFLGLLPVLLVLYIRRSAPESEEWLEMKQEGQVEKPSLTKLFQSRQLPTTLIVLFFCYSLFSLNWPISGLLPSYLEIVGHDKPAIESLMFFAGFGTLLGTLTCGFLGDRFGFRIVCVSALLLSLLFLVPVFMLPKGSGTLLSLLLFCLMATNLGVAGLIPKYMSHFFPTDMRGAGIGFIYNLASIGGGVGPFVSAYLGDALGLGIGRALIYATLFWTLVVLALAWLRIPETVQSRFQ